MIQVLARTRRALNKLALGAGHLRRLELAGIGCLVLLLDVVAALPDDRLLEAELVVGALGHRELVRPFRDEAVDRDGLRLADPVGARHRLQLVGTHGGERSVTTFADYEETDDSEHDLRGFLRTLEDTLGFTPKVDFNAGVVAAGEAQIESTVTGNTSPLLTADPAAALRDTGQVFLPTNNALSPVGHVHWYLEQLGQGSQHVASRVE